jgi:hypothetical protein
MSKDQLIASINDDLRKSTHMESYPQIYDVASQALGIDSIDPAIHSRIKGGQGTPPKICDACNQRGHVADACWKRGLAFLPPALARKIRQYNLRFGDTPKVPPVDDATRPIPHIPPSSSPKNRPPTPTPAIKSMNDTEDFEGIDGLLGYMDFLATATTVDGDKGDPSPVIASATEALVATAGARNVIGSSKSQADGVDEAAVFTFREKSAKC